MRWKQILAVLLTLVSTLAVYLWWQDGMWPNGAMPTHGMVLTVASAAGAIAMFLVHGWLPKPRR